MQNTNAVVPVSVKVAVAGATHAAPPARRTSKTATTIHPAPPASMRTITVPVPLGISAGQTFHVATDGQQYPVTLPSGVDPGQQIEIQLPALQIQRPQDQEAKLWVPEGDYKMWQYKHCTCQDCRCHFLKIQLHTKRPLLKIFTNHVPCCCGCMLEAGPGNQANCMSNSRNDYMDVRNLGHVASRANSKSSKKIFILCCIWLAFAIISLVALAIAFPIVCPPAKSPPAKSGEEVNDSSEYYSYYEKKRYRNWGYREREEVFTTTAPNGNCLFEPAFVAGFTIGAIQIILSIVCMVLSFLCGEGSVVIGPHKDWETDYPTGRGAQGRNLAGDIAKTIVAEQFKHAHDLSHISSNNELHFD